MKRKKVNFAAVAPTAVTQEDQRILPYDKENMIDRVFPYLFPVLLFLGITVQTTQMSLILAAAAVLLSLGSVPFGRFGDRLSLSMTGFLLYLFMQLMGSLYSRFGEYAYAEFSKILAAGAFALLILVRARREQLRSMFWGVLSVCGLLSILCLDMSVKGWFFTIFARVMEVFGNGTYLDLAAEMNTVDRVHGLFNNGNLSGSLFALSLFLGIYLLTTGSQWKDRLLSAVLTMVCGIGFFTGISRGAFLCFFVACLVLLILVGRENRLRLFVTLLLLAVVMVSFGMLSLTLLTQGSSLGVWIVLPAGLLFWLLEVFLGEGLVRILVGHRVLIAGVLVVLLAGCGVAGYVALTTQEPFVFTEDNYLYRGVQVTPGETYTLTVESDHPDEIQVSIQGNTREQELMGENHDLAFGLWEDITFTVPDDVYTVTMVFYGPEGAKIDAVTLSDGQSLPMAYRWLPENIVQRLQKNLFADNSFLMRVQYVKDGWTLFTQAPLAGHGLGATEGLLTSVQPFFYESLYLHNHLLQILDETGLIGFAAFLLWMVGCAVLLVRKLWKRDRLLAAMFLACLVMMNLHGMMEVTFSVRMYQVTVFALTMLMLVSVDEPREKQLPVGIRVIGFGGMLLWVVISTALLGGSLYAQLRIASLDVATIDRETFVEELELADSLDSYCDRNQQVNLMGNYLQMGDRESLNKAAKLASGLKETGEFDSCYYAAAYYDLPMRHFKTFFETLNVGLKQERSNPKAWSSAFNLITQAFSGVTEENVETYVAGIVSVGECLDAANAVLLKPIELSEEHQSLLNAARSIQEEDLDTAAAMVALTMILQGA